MHSTHPELGRTITQSGTLDKDTTDRLRAAVEEFNVSGDYSQ
jgi:hypothetical protein